MLRAQLGEWRCCLLVARLCTPSDQPSRLPRRQSRVVGRGHDREGLPRWPRPRDQAPRSPSPGGDDLGKPLRQDPTGARPVGTHTLADAELPADTSGTPRADRRACVCHGCGPERCRRCRPDRARASVARSRAASAAWPCRRAAMSGVGVRWSQVRSVKQRSSPPWMRQSQSGLYRDSNIHLDGRIELHHQKWLRAECGPGRPHILI
jgi:hypothetical protein